MLYSTKAAKVILLTALSTPSIVSAHTWVEQLMAIAPNGTMVGKPGFPRNNIQRNVAGFSDASMVFLIPPNGGPANKIDPNQLICRLEQTTQTQTANSPRLKAYPGQAIALRYQENGHVTLPQNTPGKPKNGGANFVYYTTDSKPNDKFLEIHRQWTADGKGGDARGRLISTQNFDDGQCYQVNGNTISKERQNTFKHQGDKLQGQDLWCQQDIQIPADAKPGSTITLYWVWDWPTLPGTPGLLEGKQEIYTTCMDIDIVASPGDIKIAAPGFVKQDLANVAVAAQFSDIGNPTAIKAQLIPFSTVNVGPSSSPNVLPTTVVTSKSATTTATTTKSTRVSSSQPSSTAPGQVTVTVRETVTATAAPTRTRKVSQPPATVTATETDFVTIIVTQTAAAQGKAVATPASTNTECHSTAQPAYRLRARNPFYIVPSQGSSTPSAGAGC